MKKGLGIVISLFLLLSLVWQISSKTYLFVQFSINQEEIAKTLCENKEKPKSCCEGKCMLEKEIKKEEKQEAKYPSALKEKIDKTEICPDYISYLSPVFSNSSVQSFIYETEKPHDVSVLVFHPPCI